ncbi:alpha/beta hydrolase, partial [Brachybacterium sp.]
MHLKDYLDDLATRYTVRPLPAVTDVAGLETWQAQRRQDLFEQWGLSRWAELLGTTPEHRVTGTVEAADHRIERLWIRTLPDLVITANLYVPTGLKAPAPAILYLCGHSPRQKFHYQEHARRFAQLGFVTLIVDTVQHGEIPGTHHGSHLEGAFHWMSRGYSPAAAEAWNAMRAIDLLAARDDVDAARIGATGHSGGGAVSWWVAAADPRVRAIAPSSGTGGEASHLHDHTLDGHCDCYFPSWIDGTASIETYAMVAPRPVLVVAPRHDEIFHPCSPAAIVDRLGELYRVAGREQDLQLCSVEAGHRYTSASRRAISAWMLTHVAGIPTAPEEISDVDGVVHPDEELRVLPTTAPLPSQRNATLPAWFRDRPPSPTDPERVREQLRALVLRLSPIDPKDAPVRISRRYLRGDRLTEDLRIDSEPAVPLAAILSRALPGERPGDEDSTVVPRPDAATSGRAEVDDLPLPAPATGGVLTIDLRSPEDGGHRWWTEFSARWPVAGAHAIVDVRGTGDTGFHPGQAWHLRRASAMLGRTLPMMRIHDTLCAVHALQHVSQP